MKRFGWFENQKKPIAQILILPCQNRPQPQNLSVTSLLARILRVKGSVNWNLNLRYELDMKTGWGWWRFSMAMKNYEINVFHSSKLNPYISAMWIKLRWNFQRYLVFILSCAFDLLSTNMIVKRKQSAQKIKCQHKISVSSKLIHLLLS